MSDNTNLCVIDAKCGMDGANVEISQFTQNVNNIKFIIDYDFSNLSCFIVADIEGKIELLYEDGVNLIKEYDVDTNKTHLTWNIGRQFTYQSGVLIYQIVAYKDEESVWYSKEGRIIVTKSIDTNPYSIEQLGAYPNLLTRLISSFDNFKSDFLSICENKQDKEEGKGLSTEDYTKEEKDKLSTLVYIPLSYKIDETSDDDSHPSSKAVYTFVNNNLSEFLNLTVIPKVIALIDDNTNNSVSFLIDEKIKNSVDNEIKEEIESQISSYDLNTLPQRVNSIIDEKTNSEISPLIDEKIDANNLIIYKEIDTAKNMISDKISQNNAELLDNDIPSMISDKINQNNTELLDNTIPNMISDYVDNALNEAIGEALEGSY